jgi:hypothetical protein
MLRIWRKTSGMPTLTPLRSAPIVFQLIHKNRDHGMAERRFAIITSMFRYLLVGVRKPAAPPLSLLLLQLRRTRLSMPVPPGMST